MWLLYAVMVRLKACGAGCGQGQAGQRPTACVWRSLYLDCSLSLSDLRSRVMVLGPGCLCDVICKGATGKVRSCTSVNQTWDNGARYH